MGNAGNISTTPTPLCNFTTFNIKQETKRKKTTTPTTKTKLVFKQRWPFFRIVRPGDRAANATVINPSDPPPPLESNDVGGDVAENVSGRGEGKGEEDDDDDEGTSWVAFDDTCDDDEEEEEENKIIFNKFERSTTETESEFASCCDDARSNFRPSSGCCTDITFKIDEDGGLVREDADAVVAAAVPEFDLTSHQSTDKHCYSPSRPPPLNPPLKVIRRTSSAAASPLASFIAKTTRNVGYPQHVVSMLLWLSFKRRVLEVAAAQVRSKAGRVNVRMRNAVGGRIGFAGAAAKAEEELWERRIVMGRRCHLPRQDDSPYGGDDDDRPEIRSDKN